MLSVAVRRLHDTGRDGGWLWFRLLPVIGFVILAIFWSQPSEPRPNHYGP